MEASVVELKANGENEGVQHSFRITTDAFAQGDNRLVNHRTYYFMALAYGYNNYKIIILKQVQDRMCNTKHLVKEQLAQLEFTQVFLTHHPLKNSEQPKRQLRRWSCSNSS